MKWKESVDNESHGDPFALSISDLMAGILVVFILALVAMFLTYQQGVDDISGTLKQREVLLLDIKKEITNDTGLADIGIVVYEKDGIIRISDNGKAGDEGQGIFDVNKSQLNERGQIVLQKLTNILLNSYNNASNYKKWNTVDVVLIEGHTDNKDRPGEDINNPGIIKDTNLELSVDRAISAWDMMKGIPAVGTSSIVVRANTLQDIKNSEGRSMFSVAGYGRTRLLDETWEERKINGSIVYKSDGTPEYDVIPIGKEDPRQRRIEIRFIVKPKLPNQ